MNNQAQIDIVSILLTYALGFLAGPYPAAMFIAFIGSFTRTAFENTCEQSHYQCFKKWARYFAMSVGVAMFMVSACAYLSLDEHLTIMTTAFFTIFSEELLIIGRKNVGGIVAIVIKRQEK